MTTPATPEPVSKVPVPVYTGDGEWSWSCNVDGCKWWILAFSAAQTRGFADDHKLDTHGSLTA